MKKILSPGKLVRLTDCLHIAYTVLKAGIKTNKQKRNDNFVLQSDGPYARYL